MSKYKPKIGDVVQLGHNPSFENMPEHFTKGHTLDLCFMVVTKVSPCGVHGYINYTSMYAGQQFIKFCAKRDDITYIGKAKHINDDVMSEYRKRS